MTRRTPSKLNVTASAGNIPRAPGPAGAKALSAERKDELRDQIVRGEFTEGIRGNREATPKTTHLAYAAVAHGSGGILKQGTVATSTGASWQGSSSSGNTVRQGPEIYDPLLLTSNTQLPRERGRMNAWSRAFFALNPIVNNAISLHSTYPISKLNITCKEPEQQEFFQEMIEEMDLLNICVQIAQEINVIGECFPLLHLDEDKRRWSDCIIHNPDFIAVKRTAISGEPEISLKPDAEIIKIVNGQDPDSIRLRRQLPPDIIKYVKAGKNIPLDNFYISHLSRKISPYDTRGTSLIAPCFKALMLWDKLRECKYAQADNMINPITLIKLGGTADAEYKPSAEDIEVWRQIMEEAQYDKDFKIITHGSVSIESVGKQNVIDVSNDITQLIKEIYIGLQVPQVIMESGDITYANGSLSLDVLRQRYMQFQNMMTKWIKNKVFAPISQLNDFWEYEDGGNKKLTIPNIEWNHMSLFDLSDYIQTISQLVGERKLVSVHTLYRSLGLDYDDEQRYIKQESITEAIHTREKDVLSKMSLTSLKALGEDDEIPDLPDYPVPGESPEEAPLAGEEGGGGGGGMPAPPGGGGGAPPV